jgi:uncharacterized protein
MHPAFARLGHRPWPPPRGPWVGRQTWRDLLFAHWPVAAAAVRPLVPRALDIDEHEGSSWVGLVPFRMTGVAPRLLPDLPGLSAFLETNLRLYVTRGGKPGVWFLSLDAASRLAVWGARRFLGLPYFFARMSIAESGGRFQYRSQRVGGAASLEAEYGPTGPAFEAAPGTLEHFLTERYCLYAAHRDGPLQRTEIHHRPWPLQPASATIAAQSLLAAGGVAGHGPPPLLHFARCLEVVVWPPRPA